MSNLRLRGESGSYVIALEFWDDILTWAEENGWEPEQSPDRYRVAGNHERLDVTTVDASNLADVLEFIAGDIVLHEMDVSDDFIRKLVDGLMDLTVLFQSSGFQIVQCED